MGKRGRQSWTHLMEREDPEQARKEIKNLKLMLTCLRCLVACIITTYSSHAKERLSTGVRDFRANLERSVELRNFRSSKNCKNHSPFEAALVGQGKHQNPE